MTKRVRVFNDNEIVKLLKNPNVLAIKNRSQIVYSNEFKYTAVLTRLKYPEKTARQIFEEAGFDMNILNERTPQRRICYWLHQYEKFGEEYFKEDNKYTFKAKKKKQLIGNENTINKLKVNVEVLIKELFK